MYNNKHVNYMFPIMDLIENMQIYCEIFSMLLPICMVAVAVKDYV
jgi:hypothetical protein